MDEATFNWSNFYGEFATTLLEYKNDRKGLISKLKSAYEETGMKLPKMESNGEILDIDPFTIFGLFNKGITDDNRKRILGEIAKQFNLKNKVPFSFEGIPLVNNLRSTFFNFAEERGENDINNLWEVFESAIRYADNPTQGNKLKIESTYNNVIKQKGIQWNITMGLYWIRPNTYINLDSKNREFIIKQKILPQQFIKEVNQFKNVPNGEQYIQLCDLLLEKIKDGQYGYRDFKELSFIAYERNMSVDTVTQHNTQNTDIAKNTILYGPPGTGKTYNTVMYAVAIIENKKLEEIKKENYTEFIDRYNKYKEDGLIEFTTFHQSYGYEEFIEGIKPVIHSDEEDETDIQYEVVPGLFKKFCDIAGKPILRKEKCDIGINESPTIWKISLEGSGENSTRTECMKNEHIRIGYDEYGREITNLFKGVAGRHILNYFINDMSIGDIVMSCYDCNTVDAIGVVTGEYEWHNEYPEYKRLRKVNWIVKGIKENIIKINNGSRLSNPTVYKLRMDLSDVMEIIEKYSKNTIEVEEKKKNHVFIIDEINRGNISKIFGELITLIEPTKRIGQTEGQKVRLPYSQKLFGVPNNVYLIGTMNTADRSIATIDTALRRRFNFKEMLPDEEVLDGIYVEDVSIKDIFIKMNKRITVLFDREHTLGHAYFLPLKDAPTIETLANIFENSIIPLLQEYFYEDYEKIRMVLGDNQKDSEDKQFITIEENDYNDLFGYIDYDFDEMSTYKINSFALTNIEAYRSI
ncbi:AAA family ATPase [Intestinibacter bartlettii]|uniref:AAA family ATPase n=2 Tax=Intestinibacter bartlettii TaxID=261299 RepID=UPI001D11A541|nr:AAA family ATPase [Intestinibacter bartlettii]MCC2707516.1 AAA family ATPase [Intestinibacter bartlettii]MCC2762966.1 AAA family ATPase [Intestinibacter bartlettii]